MERNNRTKILNLPQTKSFWLQEQTNNNTSDENNENNNENSENNEQINKEEANEKTVKATFTIIGCGISGVSTAYHLANYLNQWKEKTGKIIKEKEEIEILVLESQKISSRATGRNGGHLRASRSFLLEEEEFEREGIFQFLQFCQENNIDCEYFQTGKFKLFFF